MKIVVRINGQKSPELDADLGVLPPRARAERLRTLATAGLAALRGTAVVAPTPLSTPTPPVVSEELTTTRRALLRKLGAGLDHDS